MSESPKYWEVEQKYVLHDEETPSRLVEAGFELCKTEKHSDQYFRHPCRDFRETDEAFRLRTVNDDLLVTYKGKHLDRQVKVRPEIELALVPEEREQWMHMLTQLGFEPLPEVKKVREIYRRPESDPDTGETVTMDQVDELGLFAEVEVVVEGAQGIEAAESRVQMLAERLGLQEIQPLSYLAQLLRKRGIER
ncbi:MAG: class IV adenylate cyclase [Planctomycetota bacterium]